MKEKFVSFEQAQLLKECGFDWKCDHYYWKCDNNRTLRWHYPADNMNEANDFCSAPHLWSAQKWLREVHNIHIQITYTQNKYWKWRTEVILVDDFDNSKMIDVYKDYESALAAGITQALELIKQK